uniref:Carbonyl reductase [NADPH] 1-like n=1 Tax=Phallusia mammillata TaxID=59560 RepID=A0A6F9D969_9ASCI|nr:carbonyl reductase [NADPH] 1-like [Phallusia mammillata]
MMNEFIDAAQSETHGDLGYPSTAYGVSKIGVVVMTKIYARMLREKKEDILINVCCPGWVRTDMAGPKATKSPEEGAETPVYLALLPEGATEPHGQFVSEKKVQEW